MNTLPMLLVSRALVGAESLPLDQRADLYEAAAECLEKQHPDEAATAHKVADTLREASALQLTFNNLLSPAKA